MAAGVSKISGQADDFDVVGTAGGGAAGAVGAGAGAGAGEGADAGDAGRAFGASSESCNPRWALKTFEQRPQRTCPAALRSISSLMRKVV
ncbi:MAG TPA: hypothetical protein VIC71_00755 [Gammaproteobacteria bacterium]